MHYILDTHAWIEYCLGSKQGKLVKKLLDNSNNAFTTLESTIAELNQWCLREEIDFSKILLIIRSHSSIEPVNLRIWIAAAKIRHERKKLIKDFGLMDAILLAKQREMKCKIITGDKHFRETKNVVFLK